MPTQLRFSDHTAFHRQVLRMTVAGASFGLFAHLLAYLFPLGGHLPQVMLLALSATVLGLAALPPQRGAWMGACLLGLGLGLIGALSLQALSHGRPTYPWFGFGVYGLSVGILAGRDLKGHQRYLLPLATGVSVVLATYVVAIFRAKITFVHYVPSFVAEPVYGALYGFLVSVALAVRQLAWSQDPVARACEQIRPSLRGEMLELADQAVSLYVKIRQVLRDRQAQGGAPVEPKLVLAAERLVLRIFAMGQQWQEVELGAGATKADDLVERIETLEQKIEQSSDEVARKQYRAARDALSSQLRYLKSISRNRERVVARVHNYLATLERLHLALWNHRGTDAAKLSDEVQPILDELDDIGHEMDFASQAMDEVIAVAEQEQQEEDQAEDPESALNARALGA